MTTNIFKHFLFSSSLFNKELEGNQANSILVFLSSKVRNETSLFNNLQEN